MKLTRQENRELNAILDKLVEVERELTGTPHPCRLTLRDASIALADFINRKGRRLPW